MQKFMLSALVASLLLLNACSSAIKMQDTSVQVGQYRITALEIVPAATLHADEQQQFKQFQPLLNNALNQQLIGKGSGREVWVSVEVKDIDLAISSTRAILIGDSYNVFSNVNLLEPSTRRVLGSRFILSKTGRREGIAGAMADGFMSSENEIDRLAKEHAERIVSALYPKE